MEQFLFAIVVLLILVATSIKVANIWLKSFIFVLLGVGTVAYLWIFQGELGHHNVHHTFAVDYPQFIFLPLMTVLVASLKLFELKVDEENPPKLGWFLWLVLPIVGNFLTTWAVVPIILSLTPYLRKKFPKQWIFIAITASIFSMNFLALATLLADPPQALWAIKSAAAGKPLGFFEPFIHFWPYILITWGLYLAALWRLGVEFGPFLKSMKLKSIPRAILGIVLVGIMAYGVLELRGYEVTMLLGTTFFIGMIIARFMGKHEWHDTWHWSLETATIFIAFFSVVAFAHTGLAMVEVPNEGMIPIVILMTMFADNAAAFAGAYPQFVGQDPYMIWYNLFNSVVYGGLSVLGNGPQITLFLVIFVGKGWTKFGEIFKDWAIEAMVFAPYILTWTVGSVLITRTFAPAIGLEMDIFVQLFIGLVAFGVSSAAMNHQFHFRVFGQHGIDNTGRSQDIAIAIPKKDQKS